MQLAVNAQYTLQCASVSMQSEVTVKWTGLSLKQELIWEENGGSALLGYGLEDKKIIFIFSKKGDEF